MIKSKVNSSDELLLSEPDINKTLSKEAELLRLQRQYRLMEGDRKVTCESSKAVIAKQSESIKKLQEENSMLHFQLVLVERRINYQEKNGIKHKKAKETINKGELNVIEYQNLMNQLQEIEMKINNMHKKIERKKYECSGVNFFKESYQYKQHIIDELENKLNKALVKYNQTLAVNKKTRSLIDTLRGERACFDNLSRKYKKAINEQKKKMTKVIEASTAAYETRVDAQNKISVLKEKTEKEYQVFIQEMNEINRQLEQDQKLKEFMNTKNQEKVVHGRKRKNGESQNDEEETIYQMYNKTLNNYESIFNTIRKETGIEDINEFIKTFNDIEDENFSLFNYVSEISNKIDYNESEIKTLQEKIVLLKKDEKENQEMKQEMIKQMEERLETNKEKNEYYINDTRSKQNIVDIICQNITEIVQKLIEFKSLPTADFYLAPSVFVTNAQAIIEKQNKLKEDSSNDNENNDENKSNELEEDKQVISSGLENKDNLLKDIREKEHEIQNDKPDILNENEVPFGNSDEESKNNEDEENNKDNENNENNRDNENNGNNENNKDNEYNGNNENNKDNEYNGNNENNKNNENNENNELNNNKNNNNKSDNNEDQVNNTNDNKENVEKKDSLESLATNSSPNIEIKEQELTNLERIPTSSNILADEDNKKNIKLTEDVINLILDKPKINKIVDTKNSKNATIINLLNDKKVNPINLIEVLRYIEEKTNELLVFNYMTHLPKHKESNENEIKTADKMFTNNEVNNRENITLLGSGPEAPINNLNIKIPDR
jgi:hypothetical protein